MKMKNSFIFLFGLIFVVIIWMIFFKPNDCVTKISNTAKICTNYGDMVFETYDQDAPETVDVFYKLARSNFYDDLIFHQVKKGFIIQGGDPFCTSDDGECGVGGPGFTFKDELDSDTPSAQEGYVRGVIAMANAGPDTNGSQFFIVHQDTLLAHKYTIFGKIISGGEVLDEIANVPVDENDRPVEPVVITDIHVKR